MPEVVVYTKRWCGYCSRAKRLLRRRGVSFREVRAGNAAAARRDLFDRYGVGTFPQIVVGGRHIGGADELAALDETGELARILAGHTDP